MKRMLRETRGAAAVETAFLVSLILVPLLVGTVEFGFALRDWLSVSSAAREGARVGSAATDQPGADCLILEAAAGSLSSVENDQVQELWIYKSDVNGSVLAAQKYRTFASGDDPAFLKCTTWFQIENGWPDGPGRDNSGTDRDWLGVRVRFDHEWITGLLWFNGAVSWEDDAVMRLEPETQP